MINICNSSKEEKTQMFTNKRIVCDIHSFTGIQLDDKKELMIYLRA